MRIACFPFFIWLSLEVGESSSVFVMSSPSQNDRDGTDESYTLEQIESILLDSPEPPEQHLCNDESDDELPRDTLLQPIPELVPFIQTEQNLYNDASDDELPRDALLEPIPDLEPFLQTDHLINETVATLDFQHQSKAQSHSAGDKDRKRDRGDDDSTTKRPIKRSRVSRRKKASDSSANSKEAAVATSLQPAPSLETRVQPAGKGRYKKRGSYSCGYCGQIKENNHNLNCEFGERRRKKKLVNAETQTPVPASESSLESHERSMVFARHILQGYLYVRPEEENSDTRDSKERAEEEKQSAVPGESAKKDQKEVPADKEDNETAQEQKGELKPPPEEGNNDDSVGETAAV